MANIKQLVVIPGVYLLFYVTLCIAKENNVVTYAKLQPVFQRACVPCHYTGGPAPFPLTTYREVRKKAHMLTIVTSDGYMPPQRNDAQYRAFAHERRLTDQEIASIAQWVKDSVPLGKLLPTQQQSLPPNGMQGFNPTITLSMKKPVPIPSLNKQHYICYAIPFEFEKEQFVRGIEYVPGNKELSHHASYQVLEVAPDVPLVNIPEYFVYSDTQRVVDTDDYQYFRLVSKRYGSPIETFHAGWLPGVRPLLYPPGIGFRLPKRGVFMIRNLHYAPTPREASDSASIRLMLSEKECRTVEFAAFKPTITAQTASIPADTIVEYSLHVKIGAPMSVLNINPHMHRLGKSFSVWAETPQHDTIPLCLIPRWDFDWQEFYMYKKPVVLPAGTVLNATAVFDNTKNNPQNPNHPPKRVDFEVGMNDDTEMMRLVLLALPYRKGDENIELETQPRSKKKR